MIPPSDFLNLKGLQAIQAILNLKEQDRLSEEFPKFYLGYRDHFIKELKELAEHINEDRAILIVKIIKMFAIDDAYHLSVLAELAKIPHLVINAERPTIEGQLTDLIDKCSSEVFKALQGFPEEFLTHARAAKAAKIGSTQFLALKNGIAGLLEPWKMFWNEVPQFVACKALKPVLTYSNQSNLGDDICNAITPKSISAPNGSSHFNSTGEIACMVSGAVLAANSALLVLSFPVMMALAVAPGIGAEAGLDDDDLNNIQFLPDWIGGRLVMSGLRFVNRFFPWFISFPVTLFNIAAVSYDDMQPVELSWMKAVGCGASFIFMPVVLIAYPLPLTAALSYTGLSIGSTYASSLGYSNGMAMVLQPALAADHAEKQASPPVIALLKRSLNKNVGQLRDEARTLVTSLSPDRSCWKMSYIPIVGGLCVDVVVIGDLYKSWACQLANDIHRTVIDAMKANQTLLVSDKETYFNATHVMVNCKDYSQAENLLKAILREQTSFTGRLWLSRVDAVEVISSLFLGSTSELSKLCYDYVDALKEDPQASIQAVLNLKKTSYASADFWKFNLPACSGEVSSDLQVYVNSSG